MTGWLTRPAYVIALALAGGAALAGGLAVFLLTRDGDDEGAIRAGTATPVAGTATLVPASRASPTGGTPGATGTPTAPLDPDEALAAFVREELDAEYLGSCPRPAGHPPGYCSLELYRSADLVTFFLGIADSEFGLEAVLTRSEDGTWAVRSFAVPGVGEVAPAVGADAVVYGAGSCLNFRAEPSLSAEVLTCQLDGTRARVTDGPVEADSVRWWRLEGLGWASGEFLAPAR